MKYSASFLAFVGAVSGLALPESPFDLAKRLTSMDCDYHDCESFDNLDLEDTCSHDSREWDDRSIAANIWWQTGAGIWLDNYIKYNHLDKGLNPDDWLAAANSEFEDSTVDNTIAWDCASIPDGNCAVTASCEDYFNTGNSDLYYINFAAMQVHSAFSTLHDNLQDWAITANFNVGDIVQQFVGDVKGINPFGIAGGAFGIAAGMTGLAGPLVSGGLGMVSGSFGIAAATYSDHNDPEAPLNDQIGLYFSTARDSIQSTLNNAFGIGDSYDINALPLQTEEDYNETPIARFFADGKWLMYNTADVLSTEFMDASNRMMTNGLVIAVLRSQKYFVWVNTDLTSEEDCTGESSRTWIVDQCYALMQTSESTCSIIDPDGCSYSPTYIEEDRWNTLTDPNGLYQLSAQDFFTTAYDCQRSFPNGDGTIDASALSYDGSIPKCFYNVPVSKGTWSDTDGVQTMPL